MKKNASGKNTLLMSVLMSAPGPLIIGLGLIAGRSSTQLADFVRRSAELLAIIAAYVVYLMTSGMEAGQEEKRARYERRSNFFVGAMMCLSGALMMLTTFLAGGGEKGNVITGLVIAALGMVANTIFWRKYTRLGRESGNAILLVQARLYRAKSLVDTCVTAALATVFFFPGTPAATWLDLIGSLVVEVYLIHCGIKTIREAA